MDSTLSDEEIRRRPGLAEQVYAALKAKTVGALALNDYRPHVEAIGASTR